MKEHADNTGSRYLDPLSDAGFTQLFGNEASAEVLIDLLNTLLEGDEVISGLEHRSDRYSGLHPRTGEVLLDLLCTNSKGEQFPLHLQRSCQGIAYESLFFHSARLLQDQPGPEESKADFQRRAYVLGLMNFTVPTCEDEEYNCIMDRRMLVQIGGIPGDFLYDVKLVVKAIEVPGFRVSEKGLQTDMDKWLFLLNNLGGMHDIPGPLRNTPFEKVFLAATV